MARSRRRNRPWWARPTRVIPALLAAVALAGVAGGLVWTQLVYEPEPGPLARVYADPNLRVKETSAAYILTPTGPRRGKGLLFFPGAKVDARAYLSKLSPLTAQGITVVVAKPVLNIALFDSRAVATFLEGTEGANRWYVGGHSLGGVKACSLTRDPRTVGLVLVASYCTEEVKARTPVLVITGTNDRILNRARADATRANLPAATTVDKVVLDANHASFGDYGRQSGDGPPVRPPAEVAAELTAHLLAFMK